ncbi:HsdM family class I SAM-dependent methyltransferase [Haloferula sargassicola]|uniref:site-specific DNA-methyltransferase (adenine-specific) n=1 Tax=Haloferula sargassicola TaxID=490096 RepID=A0ABP9UKR7_9BACT
MSSALFQPLPEPPRSGFRYYRTEREIRRAPELLAYQHLLLRAWEEMKLTAVLTLNGLPTVYVRDSKKPLPPAKAAELQCQFWNQGLATVLLLREPGRLRVFSSMERPVPPVEATNHDVDAPTVETLNLLDVATQAAWVERFYLELGNGQYYAKHSTNFNPRESVDAWLIDNLEAVRDVLTSGANKLSAPVAHAFLGRILFTCYLCHRGIIKLENYVTGGPWEDLRDLLKRTPSEKIRTLLYTKLFPKLRETFNGSMFDDDLGAEQDAIQPRHLEAVLHFLEGSEVKKGQRSLGFWAYRFDFIPVETISSIYEKFLEHEDGASKRKLGAYYTPRLLAEMTLDLALRDRCDISGLRFIDPSCGSGIFLVLAFNRLVAAWNARRKSEPSVTDRADALLTILGQLRGVDMNLTACRIACFSLYLAFLDQFSPSDVKKYVEVTRRKLPNLLVEEGRGLKRADIPVIWKRDFLTIAKEWQGQFDIIVGNPPWEGRGKGQIANRFMEAVPGLLAAEGRSALILPSKIFLNKTDDFQRRWLGQVTLETMIQLADYRFILFKEAVCPACVVAFTSVKPTRDHEIEYIAPKVTRVDLRDGQVPISPQDRKWIRLSALLDGERQDPMSVVWKTRLWGTPRDQKLLDYLFTLPRLSELATLISKKRAADQKRWIAGQGCKPWKANSKAKPDRVLKEFGTWAETDRFVIPDSLDGIALLCEEACVSLRDHFTNAGYLLGKLYSKPPECLFTPPLVLLNQGFSEASFSKRIVRFQHSLQSFSNPAGGDQEALSFLAAFFRSKLARYMAFHTASNLATERNKVHLDEVLRLPFFLPGPDEITSGVHEIYDQVVSAMRSEEARLSESAKNFQKEFRRRKTDLFEDDKRSSWEAAWLASERASGSAFRSSLDPLFYQYFGLTDQDIALVEDTCDIFDKGDTPTSLESAMDIPTLQPIDDAKGLEPYSTMLTKTLNQWASGPMKSAAAGTVDRQSGFAMVELTQTREEQPFRTVSRSGKVLEAARRLQDASVEKLGNTLGFQRNGWFFEGKRIFIVKTSRVGEWTRTAALNDAAELFAHISQTRFSGRA